MATWPEGAVQVLREKWIEGLSATQIAKVLRARNLGNYSRNSVIGKVHRLNLPLRSSPFRPGLARRRQGMTGGANQAARAPRPPRSGAKPSMPTLKRILQREAALVAEALGPVAREDGTFSTMATIGARQCRYGYGEPSAQDFAFCGRPTEGGSWCAGHARLVYQPAPARKRKADYVGRGEPAQKRAANF